MSNKNQIEVMKNNISNQTGTKVPTVQSLMKNSRVLERFENILQEEAGPFMASVINATMSNPALSKADPNSVIASALVAATLKLPIDQNLGFSAIVPYGNKAQFQMMWRGFVQLAIRTAQYERMNVTEVYEDELLFHNPLTGEVKFTDMADWKDRVTEDPKKIIGYYAYFKLLNGYVHELYWTKSKVEAHAKKYSKSFHSRNGRWQLDFDAMAKKTVLKRLLSQFGILSTEMQTAIKSDQASFKDVDDIDNPEYVDNSDFIDIDFEVVEEKSEDFVDAFKDDGNLPPFMEGGEE